jgi:ABC-2 type transport system ATP-binding protein
VDDVSFSARPGEVTGYLGPNGSGKSTTMKMITGLIERSSGHIFFQGKPVEDDPLAYRRRFGYVPEEPYLYNHLSGAEYLIMVSQLRNLPQRESSERIDGMLRLLSLYDDRHASISGYSKGMRQKVLIIAALLHNPDLILLDEPFSGLDVGSSLVLRSLIQELASRGKVVLFCSHELDTVERVCSRVVILHRGKVVADDSIEHLRTLMELPTLEAIIPSLPLNRIRIRWRGRWRISSMRKLIERLLEYLPLQFRILNRQFLLRVVDLEALSIEADIPRFLGQFTGVLIMISLIFSARLVMPTLFIPPAGVHALLISAAWPTDQSLIETMMLVAGLIVVASWDATFPDRRDCMVLSPLPVTPRMILLAKVSASSAVLGLAVLALNVATGLVCPLFLGSLQRSIWGVLQFFAAWWFTMTAASAFLYCSVLTVQGFTALLLPRSIFMRLSAVLQLAAFGLLLGVYFMQPSLTSHTAMAAPQNQWVLAASPSYWFFALFNQLNGSLPPSLAWLAMRAWIGLGIAVFGAAASMLLCYLRTMKKTVEEPDLVPGAGGLHWTPRFGSSLQTAIVLFSFRSLMRSRQHRVILAFFYSVVFAIALSILRDELPALTPAPLTPSFSCRHS